MRAGARRGKGRGMKSLLSRLLGEDLSQRREEAVSGELTFTKSGSNVVPSSLLPEHIVRHQHNA
jgi:hypothetical protein